VLLITWVGASVNTEVGKRVVLGHRSSLPSGWIDAGRVRDTPPAIESFNGPPTAISFVIVLSSQTSDAQLLQTLRKVSHPTSPRYGMHLEYTELAALVSPAPSSFEAVEGWLLSFGLSLQQVMHLVAFRSVY